MLQQQLIDTPIGSMLAITSELGLALLEFGDSRWIEKHLQVVQKCYGAPIFSDGHAILAQTQRELTEYFAGRRRRFTIPLDLRGTTFQIKVWQVLQGIPYGETLTYWGQACAVGDEKLIRAAARANGENRVAIIIPCHRVIGDRGRLVGYAGGLARKRFLLTLERQYSERVRQDILFSV